MAKVIASFKLSGTLDGINFSNTPDGNIARTEREKYMTSKEFMANPIYDRIREHGKEMGYCAKKSRVFRQLAVSFYKNSKDVSFAGRANQLLLEILEEDSLNAKGKRTLEEGMKSPFLHEILIGFEGNKHKPLAKVLLKTFQYQLQDNILKITNFTPIEHLIWPEEATHVYLALATANWDYINNTFETHYGEEICCTKESLLQNITLCAEKPIAKHCHLSYLYVGFAIKERRKYKLMHRRKQHRIYYRLSNTLNACCILGEPMIVC